jgi:hypothetical protein
MFTLLASMIRSILYTPIITKFLSQKINYDVLINTSKPLECTKLYRSIISYVSGNCEFNSKLSKNKEVTNIEQKIIDDITNAQELVIAIDEPIILIHGFERFTNYSDYAWKIGNIIKFKHVLSKTINYNIAESFAKSYEYYSFFFRKYLLVNYKNNSKHIIPDIKIKYIDSEIELIELYDDSEFEFIRIGERLKFIGIEYKFGFFYINKYYIFENID